MNINKISDEELMNAYEGKLGYLVWHKKAIAQFIRQCVKDSQPSEKQIYAMLDEIEKNMSVTFDMTETDKDELVAAIRKLMEGENVA